MNKHFEDTGYYIKRAGQTTRAGLGEELEPLRSRIATLSGRDEEIEPSRVDRVRQEFDELREASRARLERIRGSRATR